MRFSDSISFFKYFPRRSRNWFYIWWSLLLGASKGLIKIHITCEVSWVKHNGSWTTCFQPALVSSFWPALSIQEEYVKRADEIRVKKRVTASSVYLSARFRCYGFQRALSSLSFISVGYLASSKNRVPFKRKHSVHIALISINTRVQ